MNIQKRLRCAVVVGFAFASLFFGTTPAVELYGVSAGGIFVRFDSATPATPEQLDLISGIGAGESIFGLDFRPADGRLYALTVDDVAVGRLYRVERSTAAATFLCTLAADPSDLTNPFTSLSGGPFEIDFNPQADRLRVVGAGGANFRVNPSTCLVTTDASLNPGTPEVTGVGYTNPQAAATSTLLLDIDTSVDSLLQQNPPNNGTLVPIGSLGVAAVAPAPFDIGTSGVGYAALTVGGVARIYSINIATGAATLTGNVAGNLPLTGLAVLSDTVFRNGFE